MTDNDDWLAGVDDEEPEPETEERVAYVTYRIVLDMPKGAEPNQITEHQDVTAPATGEIIDWYFEEERGRR